MRRMLAVAVLLALGCVGCGVRPSGVIPGDSAPTGPVNGVTLYFVRDNQLVATLRATDTELTPTATMSLLVAGQDAQEMAVGLHTQIPVNTGPVTLTSDATGTTLQISVDPSQLSTLAENQLVCTAQTALSAESASSTGGFFVAGPNARIGPLARCSEIS